jgi:hypothetical protein
MLTSHECLAHAEQKLAQAGHDGPNRKRLVTAAEGWLFLASQMRRLEASFEIAETAPKGRPTTRVKTSARKTTKDEPA